MKNDINEKEFFSMINDTSELIKKQQSKNLSSAVIGGINANTTVDTVEFWKWLGRNYPKNFGSFEATQQTISTHNLQWTKTILQGKGYEWDWMTAQRNNISNVFSKYVAGDCPTQPGIDIITQTSILTGDVEGMYQNKAYLSSNNPKKNYMTVFKYRKGKRKWMF